MKKKIIVTTLMSLMLASCTIFDIAGKSSESSNTETASSSKQSDNSSSVNENSSSTNESPSSPNENSSSDNVSSSFSESSSSQATSSSSSDTEGEYNPANYYEGYYSSLTSWTNGEDLKNKLHAIISGGTYSPLPYTGNQANWESLQDADESLYDHERLDVLYSSEDVLKTKTDTGWQREHAFCATLMCGSTTGDAVKTLGRATDWHNLFAANASANMSRGNKNYGNASSTSGSSYEDRTTSDGYDGYSYDNKNFEPGDKDKGRVSRAIFYMATMYTEDVYDSVNKKTMKGLSVVEDYVDWSGSVSYDTYAMGNLSTLLEWSKLAVDLSEYHHNESVYSYTPSMYNHPQGNRNPYVDYPELVDYVFGEKKNEAGELKYIKPSAEELNINGSGIRHYAIKEAKRDYGSTEAFSKSDDIKVVAVDYSFNETDYSSFTIEGATDGEAFTSEGNHEITIKTPINSIKYTVTVGDDPMETSLYNYNVNKNDFSSCVSAIVNTVTLSGVSWNVYWKQNNIGNNNAKGLAFGTAKAPIDTMYFETAESFAYNEKSSIRAIYLRGSAASNENYKAAFYIGDNKIYSTSLGYVSKDTPCTIGTNSVGSLSGKIKIEITNITAAIYIKGIAIDAI